MEPLRIGTLGASRIAPEALFIPASITGDRLVAVAARDKTKATPYAAEHGIERVLEDYRGVIEDPDVEVIYNPLANGLHAPWNSEAMKAGKHVLSEKPSASTAAEAARLLELQQETGMLFMEAFHYRYHPVMERMMELSTSGEIGELRQVDIVMGFPQTDPTDPRWDFDLAGGALMDVGCYAVHGIRTLSGLFGGEPIVDSASAVPDTADDRVDAELSADLQLANGATAHFHSSFLLPEMTFTMKIIGSGGEAFAHNFCKAALDNRITITKDGASTVEHHGDQTSYTYQLQAFARHVRQGDPIHSDARDALAQAIIIDACYTAAGMPLRAESHIPEN
jgi:predicted dehydrogenase